MNGLIRRMKTDERKAVKEYGRGARRLRKSDPTSARLFRHIQSQERHHAQELGKRIRSKSTPLSSLRRAGQSGD